MSNKPKPKLSAIFKNVAGVIGYLGPMAVGAAIQSTVEAFKGAAVLAHYAVSKCVEAAAGAYTYIQATPEERAEWEETEKKLAIQQAQTEKFLTDIRNKRLTLVSNYVIGHPAAPKTDALVEAGIKQEKIVSYIADALYGIDNQISHLESPNEDFLSVTLEESGRVSTPHSAISYGKDVGNLKVAVEHGLRAGQKKKVDEQKVDAVWNWIHQLATSGEAPHLFSAVVSQQQRSLVISKDFIGLSNWSGEEWRADYEAAVASRRPTLRPRG